MVEIARNLFLLQYQLTQAPAHVISPPEADVLSVACLASLASANATSS